MTKIVAFLRSKPGAEKFAAFIEKNEDFLPRVAAEFFWLKRQGRKAGSIGSVIDYLRWSQSWRGVDEFAINDDIGSLAIRVCIILWPELNGMAKMLRCKADDVLGTQIKRTKRYGSRLTWNSDYLNGVERPAVPEITKVPSFHVKITPQEAGTIEADFHRIINAAPNPNDPVLRTWLAQVKEQPEIFVFMIRTLRRRNPAVFSGKSLYRYTRGSIRRAATAGKQFTLPEAFVGLYSRALVILNPDFNGKCEFKKDSEGTFLQGRANRLLGTTIAKERVNGEPFRRLVHGSL